MEQAVRGAIWVGSFGTLRRIFTLLEDRKGAVFQLLPPFVPRATIPPAAASVERGDDVHERRDELRVEG